MALPLNVFKTVPCDVPAIGTEIYEAPVGYNAIVLLAQASNTDSVAQYVSLSFNRNSVATAIVHDFEVPANEVLTISGGNAGKLILETGDKLILSGTSTDLKFILSLIETLK